MHILILLLSLALSVEAQLLEYPHDTDAFCQGFAIHDDGFAYEGTGLYRSSEFRRVELATGRVVNRLALKDNEFGEGITVIGRLGYQLTWKNKVGYVINLDTFTFQGTFDINTSNGEGWGITHSDTEFFVSDGSNIVTVWDRETMQVVRQISVFDDNGNPVTHLNELEYVQELDVLFANIWKSTSIVSIDPSTGKVDGFLDYAHLSEVTNARNSEDVLNGIAYRKENGKHQLLVTGKRWSKVYVTTEIEQLKPRGQASNATIFTGSATRRFWSPAVCAFALVFGMRARA